MERPCRNYCFGINAVLMYILTVVYDRPMCYLIHYSPNGCELFEGEDLWKSDNLQPDMCIEIYIRM